MNADATTADETTPEPVEHVEPPKKTKKKNIHVTVLRAIDRYHHRGAQLSVPDDEYHRGLIRIGNLRVEQEG